MLGAFRLEGCLAWARVEQLLPVLPFAMAGLIMEAHLEVRLSAEGLLGAGQLWVNGPFEQSSGLITNT